MNKYTLTTKTYNQLASEFAAAFKGVMPPDAPKLVSLTEALQPYRPHILKQRGRGLTWKQIAEVMARPPIGVRVSPKLLHRLFGKGEVTKSDVPAAKSKAGETAPTASTAPGSGATSVTNSTSSKPVSRRLILDPYTNLPITEP